MTAEDLTRGERHLNVWMIRLAVPSFVYVLQGDDSAIKVGRAYSVPNRIASLQTGNPQILRLLEVVPGDRRLEWNLHRRLAPARVHGEWFDGPEVPPFLDYMANLARAMVDAYDGSGRAPRYTDFDTFDELPPRPPARDSRRASRVRRSVRRPLATPVAAAPTPPSQPPVEKQQPTVEEQELWSRIAQMWIAGATRKEIRGAEGLSQDRLRRIIKKMRENGYELAEGLTLLQEPNRPEPPHWLGPHRRRHAWRR